MDEISRNGNETQRSNQARVDMGWIDRKLAVQSSDQFQPDKPDHEYVPPNSSHLIHFTPFPSDASASPPMNHFGGPAPIHFLQVTSFRTLCTNFQKLLLR
jgi:hypothetical protein